MPDGMFSKTITISNPLKPVGKIKMLSGSLNLIVGLLGAYRAYGAIVYLQEYALVLTGFVCLVVVISSVKSILTGMQNQQDLLIPPRTPKSISNRNDLEAIMLYKDLQAQRISNSKASRFVRSYISDKVTYLTSRTRAMVDSIAVIIIKILNWLVLFICLFVIKGLLLPALDISPVEIPISFPFLLFVPLVFIAVYYATVIQRIAPKSVPSAEVSEELAQIRGGGDPNNLSNDLEYALYDIRRDQIPNRVQRRYLDSSNQELQARDTGTFHQQIFIENQPLQIEVPNNDAASLLNTGALIFSLVGLVIGLSPAFNSYTYAYLIEATLSGIIIYSCGMGMLRRAEHLLNTFHYQSVMMFLDITGTYSTAQITAGKAITDSLESRNNIIRSDSDIKIYTSKILTEAAGLEAERDVVGMIIDPEVQRAESILKTVVADFKGKGATLVGVDLSGHELKQITELNVSANAMKEAAVQAALGSGSKLLNTPYRDNPQFLGSDIPANSPSTDLELPQTSPVPEEMAPIPGYEEVKQSLSGIADAKPVITKPVDLPPVDPSIEKFSSKTVLTDTIPDLKADFSSSPLPGSVPAYPLPESGSIQSLPSKFRAEAPQVISTHVSHSDSYNHNESQQYPEPDSANEQQSAPLSPMIIRTQAVPIKPASEPRILPTASQSEAIPIPDPNVSVAKIVRSPAVQLLGNNSFQDRAPDTSKQVSTMHIPILGGGASSDGYISVTPVQHQQETKICPMCAEEVKAAARICKHCRHEFTD